MHDQLTGKLSVGVIPSAIPRMNEPLKNVRHVAMYDERYVLLAGKDVQLSDDSKQISWSDAAQLPLCLLTPDMQNRRIIDGAFQSAGVNPTPEMETNSILALYSHVVTGKLATILPEHFLDMLATPADIRTIALSQPVVSHKIGLLIADREPAIPVAESLFQLVSQFEFDRFD